VEAWYRLSLVVLEVEQRMGKLLVLNAGSSSLKYDVFSPWRTDRPVRIGHGVVDRIGEADVPDHEAALDEAWAALRDLNGLDDLEAVAHRVVHGGSLTDPVVVDADVERQIEAACVLAPLHNPAALSGIRAVRTRWPDLPQVVVFDTAFHRTLSAVAAAYALPADLARRHQIRRWGFHGISHEYVARRAAEALGVPLAEVQLIICHVGNGVSVTAVRDGRSIDTSMGFTPMDGAVMGTRSGSIDPGVVFHLVRETDLSLDDVEDLLLHRSGMLGLCGDSDLQRVRERSDQGDPEARFALAVYAHRIRGFVASYVGQLPRLHAVVFTAGVGEHDPALREEVVEPLGHLGLVIDVAVNAAATAPDEPVQIGSGDGPAVMVVPTDEAVEVARQAHSAMLGPLRH
jgi:acetate kinase